MKNEYEIRGDVTAIIINSPKYGKFEALVSTSKLDRVKEFPNTWTIRWSKSGSAFYVQGNNPRINLKQTTAFLHRWVTGAPVGLVVDHINHDPLDNTDSNLRVITKAGNTQNKRGPQTNSTSGVRGVSWYKKNKKWSVKIQINRVKKHIGYFDSLAEAEHAAIEARMHHMPFSNESI